MKKETPVEPVLESEPKKKKDYFTLRIPRFSFENTRINGFLVVCLVIFAFLLGMLVSKVTYLEKMATQSAPTPAAPGAAEPTIAPPPQIVDVASGKLPILGDPNAKVTVVEFSDFQCPFCKRAFDDAIAQIKKEYVDTNKIAFAFRHSPLTSIHPNAREASLASECANEQGDFWTYHDQLFNTQDDWSPKAGNAATDAFIEIAGGLGMDADQFRSCLESEKHAPRVDADMQDASTVQVDGTPTFFINGYRVVGAVPFADIKKVIEAELKK
ncbi:MAG: DsbA family protein [Patescibacteria group bacterium]